MSTTTARVTIPMDKSLRNKLDTKASELGFDSIQALLRYVSKALIDGRQITFGIDYGAPRDKDGWDDWGPVPKHVLESWANQKNLKGFDNMTDFLADLHSYAANHNSP